MTIQHLGQLYDILLACGREPPMSRSAWVSHMRILIAQEKAQVWPIGLPREPDVMIGAVMFVGQPNTTDIDVHIVIRPEHHGRWCTKALRRAYDTFTTPVRLRAPIRLDNSAARTFAERLGFRPGETQDEYITYWKEPTHAAPEATQ